MRLFLLSLYVVAALSKPQGYSYQPPAGNELTDGQLQILQQYLQQQQQQQHHTLQQLDQQVLLLHYPQAQPYTTQSQTVTQREHNGGYHNAVQLLQQGQNSMTHEEQLVQTNDLKDQRISEVPNVAPDSENPLQTHVSQISPTSQITELTQGQQVTPSLPFQQVQAPQNTEASNAEETAQLFNEHLHQPFEENKAKKSTRQETGIPHPKPVPVLVPQEVGTSRHQTQPHAQYSPEPQNLAVRSEPARREPTVRYNKEFFYLSAPQEDFETPEGLEDQLSETKKNIRVVFIKAPEQNGITKAALQLAKQSVESQTAIYILTKQHDTADFANKLQQLRGTAQHKPEVIFVKYRTPAEAEQAQRTIQSQYEALDGPNYFNHEGVAPTHNFVGAAGVDPRSGSSAHGVDEHVATPSRQYLPSATKH